MISISRRLAAGWALGLATATTLLTTPLTASAQADPPQLRIGFQKSAVNFVVLKQQGALEKRFPHTKVSWVEFPAGPQLLEALSVGSIEIGLTGDTPPVFAQAAGKSLVYVGAEPPKPQSSAILVKPESTIQALADLKGKRVALQKGSSAHYLTVRALQKAGLNWNDITPVYLTPADARAAFERGSVDAWAIWDPYYAATEIDVKTRVLHNGVGLSGNNSFYLAAPEFVKAHPQAVQALLAELTGANAYVQSNRKEAAQLISDFSGLPLATIHRVLSRRPDSPVKPVPPALAKEQQDVAQAFFALGLLPKPVQVADIVWKPAPGAGPRVAQAQER